jgi:uroporphyrinogen-III synthase
MGGIPATVVDYPCIEVERLLLSQDEIVRLKKFPYDATIFISRNAVNHLLSQVAVKAPAEVIAIGSGTSKALAEHGWPVTATPQKAEAAALAQEIPDLVHGTGRVLYVRGDLGADPVPESLRQHGHEVDVAVVYRTLTPRSAPLRPSTLPTLIVFASPSAIRNFLTRNKVGANQRALAIGETTAAAAREAGFVTEVAEKPDNDSLSAAVWRWQMWVTQGAAHA